MGILDYFNPFLQLKCVHRIFTPHAAIRALF